MIAIEAIDLYTLDVEYINDHNLLLFSTRSNNLLRHVNSNIATLLNSYFECIYLIYRAIQDPSLQKIANCIISTYYNNPEETSVKQYTRKYIYYYQKTQYYYNRQSYADKIKMYEIPIYNIYIISKAYKYNENCLQYLIQYLCL
uniref:Uncharacterized protein n=1 Tax=Gelidium kathyanniae TaxID=2483893 RepID=A0A3G2QY08_9FLOR|nr:hypothetical protein [Gelidium kathyanniae]AYO27975.1 hypothetical protein [Gelidium kathyanniae]